MEDRRLRMFVKHKGSLGTGREAIIRKLLAEQTPEPYRINTGFVVYAPDPRRCSSQCDVLVYDPKVSQPLYRIDEFVVVPPEATRLVIEVRSNMSVTRKKREGARRPGLDQVFAVHASMAFFARSVLGFGFDGPTFGTLLTGVVQRMQGKPENVPDCILVHRRNYILIRVADPHVPDGPNKTLFLGIDFAPLGTAAEGFATALFMRLCHERLTSLMPYNADIIALWARDMKIPHEKLKVIRSTGEIEEGYDYNRKNQ